MSKFPAQILVPEPHWQAMLAHLRACLPEESCGLLGGVLEPGEAGIAARVAAVIPVENELHSPVRFRMAPAEQLAAFHHIEALGLELVGIFHAHPAGPDHPSATDVAEFLYPGVLSLIWSPIISDGATISDGAYATLRGTISYGGVEGWRLEAFRIEPNRVAAAAVVRLADEAVTGLKRNRGDKAGL